MDDFKGKYIWIIGATSGIGKELALRLGREGAHLLLSGRRRELLIDLQSQIDNSLEFPCDIQSEQEIKSTYQAIVDLGICLDSVIIMSGTYVPTSISSMNSLDLRHIIDTNVYGPMMVAATVLPDMLKQKAGQIVLCGSVAGYIGLPNGQPYSATKAALINFAESLRCEVIGMGIDVKIINPGFVKTPMTDKNKFNMPMIIEANVAAEVIARALLKPCFEISTPWLFTHVMKFLAACPYYLYFHFIKKNG